MFCVFYHNELKKKIKKHCFWASQPTSYVAFDYFLSNLYKGHFKKKIELVVKANKHTSPSLILISLPSVLFPEAQKARLRIPSVWPASVPTGAAIAVTLPCSVLDSEDPARRKPQPLLSQTHRKSTGFSFLFFFSQNSTLVSMKPRPATKLQRDWTMMTHP